MNDLINEQQNMMNFAKEIEYNEEFTKYADFCKNLDIKDVRNIMDVNLKQIINTVIIVLTALFILTVWPGKVYKETKVDTTLRTTNCSPSRRRRRSP